MFVCVVVILGSNGCRPPAGSLKTRVGGSRWTEKTIEKL